MSVRAAEGYQWAIGQLEGGQRPEEILEYCDGHAGFEEFDRGARQAVDDWIKGRVQ